MLGFSKLIGSLCSSHLFDLSVFATLKLNKMCVCEVGGGGGGGGVGRACAMSSFNLESMERERNRLWGKSINQYAINNKRSHMQYHINDIIYD